MRPRARSVNPGGGKRRERGLAPRPRDLSLDVRFRGIDAVEDPLGDEA